MSSERLVTPNVVNALSQPTGGFLCPLSANTFGIDFLRFSISDYTTKKIIFAVGRDTPPPSDMTIDMSTFGEDMYRKINYNFSEDVLRLPSIQTSLQFSVGNQPLKGFRMIERHYFRDRLVKSFDFSFGFCIPGSTNTWDAVYEMPPLSEELINDMIDNPFETKSDSFYFVDEILVMHNKASYKYFREDAAQSKKSYEDKFSAKSSSKPIAAAAVTASAKVASDQAKAIAAGAKLTSDMANISISADAKTSSSTSSSPSRAGAKSSKQEWSKESDYDA